MPAEHNEPENGSHHNYCFDELSPGSDVQPGLVDNWRTSPEFPHVSITDVGRPLFNGEHSQIARSVSGSSRSVWRV